MRKPMITTAHSGAGPRPPTLTFNEVVRMYELSPNKTRRMLGTDGAPKPALKYGTVGGKLSGTTYYVRAEIIAWVKANMEKLK